MNLADGDQRVAGSPLTDSPGAAVPGHRFPLVGCRKAKIQLALPSFSAIGPADTALAGAEPSRARDVSPSRESAANGLHRAICGEGAARESSSGAARAKRIRRGTPAALPRRLRTNPAS